jgi:hypothetical protein
LTAPGKRFESRLHRKGKKTKTAYNKNKLSQSVTPALTLLIAACLKKEFIHNPVGEAANISELLFDTISLKNEVV